MGSRRAVLFFCSTDSRSIGSRWLLYGLLWLLMFAVGEIGQAIAPGYSWTEAVLGVISEAVYCPLSAYVAWRLLGTKQGTASA